MQLVFNAMQGFDPDCTESRKLDFSSASSQKQTIGFIENLEPFPIQEEIKEVYFRQLRHLEAMGHRLKAVDFNGYDFAKTRRAGLLMCEVEMLQEHSDDWETQKELFSEELTMLLSWAENKTLADIAQAESMIDSSAAKAIEVFNTIDILCLPTTLQTAFPFDQQVPANQADFTSFANVAGLPALSVPTNEHIAELPTAIQFIGKNSSDLTLLELGIAYHEYLNYEFTPSEYIKKKLSEKTSLESNKNSR